MLQLKKIFFFFLFFSSFQVSGELSEKIVFNKDKSGAYQISIDINKSKQFLNLLNKFRRSKDKPELCLYRLYHEVSDRIANIQGIKNVRLTYSEDLLFFKIKFNFDNVVSLNNVIFFICSNKESNVFIKFEEDVFSRSIPVVDYEKISNKFIQKNKKNLEGMLKIFLRNFKYRTVYKFAEKRIKSPTNGYVSLRNDGIWNEIVFEKFFAFNADQSNHVVLFYNNDERL